MSVGRATAAAAGAPIHVSVVSHGHGPLVRDLLHDLARQTGVDLRVTVTLNVSEPESFSSESMRRRKARRPEQRLCSL